METKKKQDKRIKKCHSTLEGNEVLTTMEAVDVEDIYRDAKQTSAEIGIEMRITKEAVLQE